MAPIISELRAGQSPIEAPLVHTGQHYDAAMNEQFFADLQIPPPDFNLEVGSATHAVQTAEVMRRFEPIVDAERPDAVLVVGDVNSTLACALVSAKKSVPVVHVEAGLRSYDRAMPEEINRVLTDQISDLLFTTERDAVQNLVREGIDSQRVRFVGNVMIDTLRRQLGRSRPVRDTLTSNGVPLNFLGESRQYAVLTLHRPSNVDNKQIFEGLLSTISKICTTIPVIFPIHPRTRGTVERLGLSGYLENTSIAVLPPLGYHEMLGLMKDAKMVLTDSGGIQEETTALGVPCVTLRENTERPITVSEGTNTVAGTDPQRILSAVSNTLATGGKVGRIPQFWDGNTSARIATELRNWFGI